MDDSYYSGKTIKTMTHKLGIANSDLRVFVVYDGSPILQKEYKQFHAMYRYHDQ